MTTITFPRPTLRLLSLNDRAHWAVKAKAVKAWREAAWAAAMQADRPWRGINYQPSIVCITYDVHDSRRRDPSNQYGHKPIVDGMVDAGWWPDDTPQYVTIAEPEFRVAPRKSAPMVTVELRAR